MQQLSVVTGRVWVYGSVYAVSVFSFSQATGDPYYLEVGKTLIENLNKYARVPCGFAAMKDVRTGSHEDR